METGTKQIVQSIIKDIKTIRDLPKAVAILWSFGLTPDQREAAKNALKAFVLANIVDSNNRRNKEEVDRVLNG